MTLAPYQRSSGTSRAAAVALALTDRPASQASRITEYLTGRQATRQEIADALSLRLSSVCARCTPLIEAGVIVPCGTKPGPWGPSVELLTRAGEPKQGALL